MEKNLNFISIKCPYCAAEYTLAEIYIPKYITGKGNIIKDPAGKILGIDYGLEPDLTEQYNCDYCHKDFNVELDIKANSSPVREELDFSVETASLV